MRDSTAFSITVFMEQPEGFCQDPNKVCLLQRSLYGLKQSPRQWNQKFSNFLRDMNLKVSDNDNCVFYRQKSLLIIAIYVDDGIVFGHDQEEIDTVITQLSNRFEIHTVEASTFLGFQYHRGTDGSITIHQDSYIKTILKRFRMDDCKSADSPITITKTMNEGDILDENTPYREAVGSLMYAAVTTRLDISHAVNKVSRCVVNPTASDWKAVKHIMRYLKDKEDLGITYSSEKNNGLIAYCDADFAGDPANNRSTTGYVFVYGGAPILWKSQRQSLITLSSTEAEFVSLCSTVKTLIWVRRFAREMNMIDDRPTTLYCDNQSAIRIASNEKCVQRTRHMSVQASYPREQIEKGEVQIEHIKTDNQLADILTKPTTSIKFRQNRDRMMNTTLATAALAMLALLALTSLPASTFVLQRIDPLIWIPTDDIVDIGFVNYQFDYEYASPCSLVPDIHDNTTVQYVIDLYNRLYLDCMTLYKEKWLDKVQELIETKPPKRVQGHSIEKREIVTLSAVAVIGAATFSNFVVSLVKNNQFQGEIDQLNTEDRVQKARMDRAENILNTTLESQLKMLNEITQIETMLIENKRNLRGITDTMARSTWITNVVFSKIDEKYGFINDIIGKLAEGMIATRELGLLLNMNQLRKIDPRDTVVQSVWQPTNESLRFQFIAREKSDDTKVYQVVSINHWGNLTGEPYFMEYIGSEFLIYNRSSNCAKSIRRPSSRVVQEECTEQDWHDPKLNLWRKNYDAIRQREQYDKPVFIRTFEWNYFYCYAMKIETGSQTLDCPTYPFRLPISTPVKLDYINYHPKAYRTVITEKMRVIDTLPFQVYPTTIDTEELNMLKRLSETRRDLIEAKQKLTTSIQFESEHVYYWSKVAIVILILIVVMILIYLIRLLRSKNTNPKQKSRSHNPMVVEQVNLPTRQPQTGEEALLGQAYQIPDFSNLNRQYNQQMNTFGNLTSH
jgi:hypothetical protein